MEVYHRSPEAFQFCMLNIGAKPSDNKCIKLDKMDFKCNEEHSMNIECILCKKIPTHIDL